MSLPRTRPELYSMKPPTTPLPTRAVARVGRTQAGEGLAALAAQRGGGGSARERSEAVEGVVGVEHHPHPVT